KPKPGFKRVLLSGFGPFGPTAENVSGLTLEAWGSFQSPKDDADVFGVTRDIMIAGKNIQVCFLVTSTTWDIASAILVSEMEQFSPNFVLMTGRGFKRFLLET